MKHASMFTAVVLMFLLSSCGILPFQEVVCHDLGTTEESYWFPAKMGDSVTFVNTKNEQIKLYVTDKSMYHTTKYYTDTGCSCYDWSGMLLANKTDTIWFTNEVNYIDDFKESTDLTVLVELKGIEATFNEENVTLLPSLAFDNQTITDVKKYEYAYTNAAKTKTVYFAKNIGIIRFEMVNGEIWTNTQLTPEVTSILETFEYKEEECY